MRIPARAKSAAASGSTTTSKLGGTIGIAVSSGAATISAFFRPILFKMTKGMRVVNDDSAGLVWVYVFLKFTLGLINVGTLVVQISVGVECDVLYVLGIRLASASTAKFPAPATMTMPYTSTTNFSALRTPTFTILSSSLPTTSSRFRPSHPQIGVNDLSYSGGLALFSISL
ncbi:hypothetical protein BDQ12DRAFT_737635 [Crucibulum laeve]|uniref:Uncharacterized protein n=1 Tax=Crucibulum laeve TaxID=68775 RepID=A0A5C3LTD0_9AGAR|nr:hypothetical protein BDQ12DRAFT_737635 [Crucibulum laeve]